MKILILLLLTSCSYFAGSKNHDFYRAMREGTSCSPGSVNTGFLQPVADTDKDCKTGEQVCVNGAFVGPALYPSCKERSRDCGTLANGENLEGFTTETAPCVKSSHQCVDGLIVGPLTLYKSCK